MSAIASRDYNQGILTIASAIGATELAVFDFDERSLLLHVRPDHGALAILDKLQKDELRFPWWQ